MILVPIMILLLVLRKKYFKQMSLLPVIESVYISLEQNTAEINVLAYRPTIIAKIITLIFRDFLEAA